MKKIVSLLLFANCFSFAQTEQKHVGDFLDSNLKITAIAESERFCWMGTETGLLRINKKNKKQTFFTLSNSNLPSNKITAICCRKNDHVWIGTKEGIMIYDNFGYMLLNKENSNLPDEFVTALAEDKNEDMWLGTRSGGLVKIHHTAFKIYNQKNSSLTNNFIKSLSTDANGNIIINDLKLDEIYSTALLNKKL